MIGSKHLALSAAAIALTIGAALAEVGPAPLPSPSAQAQPAAPTPQALAPKPAASTPQALPAPTPSPAQAAPTTTPAPATTPAAATPGETPAPAPIPVEVAPKPKPKPRPVVPPLETALSTDPHPTLTAETFFSTQKAAERYARIVADGGWPTDISALHPGAKGEAVAKLRKRLAVEDDLESAGSGAAARKWDPGLTAAVKHFQARMGLRQTGVVAGATLKAINVPAETRAQELSASAARLSNVHVEFEHRYVVVNLPSTSVEAVQDGQVAHRYVAIVGDPDHPSPEISAHISVINLNPTWTVPVSIIKKEIIPHMQRDPSYLKREKIRILDGQGNELEPRSIDWSTERAADYTLRQDSGAGNSLGSIRIGMPNKLAVYMHDTPGKALFGRDFRFLSHGCVRVQGVYDYAAWLLEETPGGPNGVWDKAAMLDKVKEKERYDIKLSHPVPVIWVYLTGWANEDGVVNFRNDVYGIDPSAEATAKADAPAENAEAVSAPQPVSTPTPISPILDFLRSH
jgi:murein L,D-transpeptidase YcbB/YkuD